MVEDLRNFMDTLGVDWVLWLLIALSVFSLAIIIERIVFFQRYSTAADTVEGLLRKHLDNDSPDEALKALRPLPGMEAAVLSAGLGAIHKGPAAVEETMAGALAKERIQHDRFLAILGTLGNNAPFIGLFGTVVGIVSAFRELESGLDTASAAQNEAIMGSISEALVATAVGLFVAIPAVIGFNAFKSQIKRRASSSDALSRILMAHVKTIVAR